MNAVQFAQYGDPEVLQLVEVDGPHAGPGEVRIAVRAAGVNPIDWKIREGNMRARTLRPLPSGTGLEAAGMVDGVGQLLADGTLRAHIAQTFALTEAAEAQRASAAGKFIVRLAGDA